MEWNEKAEKFNKLGGYVPDIECENQQITNTVLVEIVVESFLGGYSKGLKDGKKKNGKKKYKKLKKKYENVIQELRDKDRYIADQSIQLLELEELNKKARSENIAQDEWARM